MIFDVSSHLWRGLFWLCGPQRVFVDGVEVANVVHYNDEAGIVKSFAIFEGHGKTPLTVAQVASSPALAQLAIAHGWELPDGDTEKTFALIVHRGKVTYAATDPKNKVDLKALYDFIMSDPANAAAARRQTGAEKKGEGAAAVDAGDKSNSKSIPPQVRAILSQKQLAVLAKLHRALRMTDIEIDAAVDVVRGVDEAWNGSGDELFDVVQTWLNLRRDARLPQHERRPAQGNAPGGAAAGL